MEPLKHLFTADEYQAMGAAGLLRPDQRLELIEGEVIEMTPIGPRHASVVGRLTRVLVRACGDRALVWVQNPVRLSDVTEVQPDLCVLRPRADFYAGGHPGPGDILLVIEVSDVTLAWDRRVKAPLYARSGVPELWVLDVGSATLEAHRRPGPEGYGETTRLGSGQQLALPELEAAVVEVAGLFGES